MAVQRNKMRLLYLMRILLERTDEEHVMTASELVRALEGEYGIAAERKSIYSDIEALQDFGLDIVQRKGAGAGYCVAGRELEMPELKLLVDAVQASRFITGKKTEELIRKLESFTSKYQAQQLQRQVFIYNRPKTGNETIYYNVDYIHGAISRNVQVAFQYVEWDMKKRLRLRRDGAVYQVSPWALSWNAENYYLIAYEARSGGIRHYRVDRMRNMQVLDVKREGGEIFRDFDLAAFATKTFGMYGGRDETVTLRCRANLAGVILDRFGTDVMMIPEGEEFFRVAVLVSVSRQFFGWAAGIGPELEIAGPGRVRQEYAEYLQELVEQYRIQE